MAKSYTYTINLKVNASNGKLRTADERMRSLRGSIRSLSSAMRRFNTVLTNTNNSLSSFNSQLSKAKTNSDSLARNMDKVSSSSAKSQKMRYDNRGIAQQTRSMKRYGSEIDSVTQKSKYLNFMEGFSTSKRDKLRSYRQQYSQQNIAGRSISVASEKYGNLADLTTGLLGYLGVSTLKKYLYDTPVQAQTNKWLLSTMGDSTASKDTLYSTLDTTTDKLPISMQSVAQPLYAFKAASGATAETINKVIPQFANFGAVVQNMTGSTELAETAMMKLSYGLQGKYAALDQYGITEKSLQDAGWNGDANDIEGYMNAVTKIVGNAGDSMSLFAGKVQTVDKSLSRAGKQLWEGGLGSFLTMLVSGVNDLLNVGNGAGGKIALAGSTLAGAVVTVVTGIGYFKQALGSLRKALDLTAHDATMSFKRLASNLRGGYLGGKLGLDKSVPLEDVILKSFAYKDSIQNPDIRKGLFDVSKKDMKGAGINEGGIRRAEKEKRKTRNFVKNFGYSDDIKAKIAAIDKSLPMKERVAQAAKIRRGYKSDVAEMGFRDRFALARKNAFRDVTYKDGKGSHRIGNALSRLLGSGRIRNSISNDVGNLNIKGGLQGTKQAMSTLVGGFTSLIPVINPATIALTAFTGAIAAIAGIMMYAYSVSDSFRQHVGAVGEKLKQLGGTVANLVGDVFQSIGWSQEGGSQGIVEVAEKILGAVEKVIDILQSTLDALRGTDPKRDEMYNSEYKKVKEAEDRIRERQRAGKPESENAEDRKTMDHWYGDKDRGIASYKDYLTATGEGTYFDEQRRKTNEQYGTNFQPGMSWKDFLDARREVAWGSLGVDGVGKTKEEVTQTVDNAQKHGTTFEQENALGMFLNYFKTGLSGALMVNPITNPLSFMAKGLGDAQMQNPQAKQAMDAATKGENWANLLSGIRLSDADIFKQDQNAQEPGQEGMDTSRSYENLTKSIDKLAHQMDTSGQNNDGTTQQGQGQDQRLKMASNIPQFGLSVAGSLQTMATDAWNIINGTNQTGLMQMSTDITTGAGLAYSQIPLQLQNQAPGVQMAGTNLGLSGNTGLSIGMSGMAQTAATKSNEAGNAVSSGSGAANSGGATLGNSANSGADGALDLVSIFKNEVGHIKDVILQGIPDVVSAVTSMVGAANDAAYKKEDQNSPGIISRMFGAEMGFTAMLIKKGTPDITKSIFEMVAGANKTFERNVNTLQFPVDNSQITSYIPNYNNAPMTNALNEELIHSSVRGTPSVTRSDANPNTNNNNNQTVNMTFNIERVDSEERVHEIKDVIYETLFFNNETHGRQEPTPII